MANQRMCCSTSYWAGCLTYHRRTVWCSSRRCAEAGALLGRCPIGVRRERAVAPLTARCGKCEIDDARQRRVLGSVASLISSPVDTSFSERPTSGAAVGNDDDDRDWALLGLEMINFGLEEEQVSQSSLLQGRAIARGGGIRAWLRQNALCVPDAEGSF